MRKSSYYIIVAVIAGLALVSLWAYQRYFIQDQTEALFFEVERGDIQETISARGEVVAQNDFDLGFPFSGIVDGVFVSDGDIVSEGGLLMKLSTSEYDLEASRLNALLAQKEAALAKIIAGSSEEDIAVAETKVNNAKTSLQDAKTNAVDKIKDAYTKSDDAIRNKTDQFFSNPRGSDPQLNFSPSGAQLEADLEWGRAGVESVLKNWDSSLEYLTTVSNLKEYFKEARQYLNEIKNFLDKAALAVNGLEASSDLSQTTIDGWKSDVSTARANVNTAIANITSAEEKLKTAESVLALAESELKLMKAPARSEDIKIAEAQVKEMENQIASAEDKIRKAHLYSPAKARITDVRLERGEVFSVGGIAVSLSTVGYKIQSDISELDIAKIKETKDSGNEVLVIFDAFGDAQLTGRVVSVDPKEIVKDGDKYYRVNIFLEPSELEIRSGMSADLKIFSSRKENVLKIPAFAVFKKDGKSFVQVRADAGEERIDTEVKTGISDGEFVEIVSGLEKGMTIVVSAD